LKIEKKKLRTLAALFCPVFTTVNDEKNNWDYKNRGMTEASIF
jgi:hypothetical protein